MGVEMVLLHRTAQGRTVPIYATRNRDVIASIGGAVCDHLRAIVTVCGAGLGDPVQETLARYDAERIRSALSAVGIDVSSEVASEAESCAVAEDRRRARAAAAARTK